MSLKLRIILVSVLTLVVLAALVFVFRSGISEFFLNQAQNYFTINNVSAARFFLNMAGLLTDNAHYHFLLGTSAYLSRDYKKAVEQYTVAIDMGFIPREWPLFWRAVNYFLLKDYEKSLSDYIELNKITPDNIVYLRRIAQLYYRIGNLDEALNVGKIIINNNGIESFTKGQDYVFLGECIILPAHTA